MRFVHLSDLHIGKRVHEMSMIEDQKYIFNRILAIIKAKQIDAVLIAGDVYDRTIPSAEAVTLFDEFLTALSELKTEVFVISGNHDSAERIAFGSDLLNLCGVHMSPVFNGEIKPIITEDCHGKINVYLLPFLKPVHVRGFYPEKEIESYNDAVKTVVEGLNIDKSKRNILVAHQFVTGAETAGSEEIAIGGLDNVDADIFKDFDYVALGHIHRAQAVKRNEVRYAGTPLKYSFSEAKHEKSVTVVEINEKGNIKTECISLVPLRDLREIKGFFADIMLSEKSTDYLHIILTDEEEIPDVLGKLRILFPNIMKLSYDNTRTRSYQNIDSAEDIEEKNEIALFDELYLLQNGKSMSDEQRDFVTEIIEKLKEE